MEYHKDQNLLRYPSFSLSKKMSTKIPDLYDKSMPDLITMDNTKCKIKMVNNKITLKHRIDSYL